MGNFDSCCAKTTSEINVDSSKSIGKKKRPKTLSSIQDVDKTSDEQIDDLPTDIDSGFQIDAVPSDLD